MLPITRCLHCGFQFISVFVDIQIQNTLLILGKLYFQLHLLQKVRLTNTTQHNAVYVCVTVFCIFFLQVHFNSKRMLIVCLNTTLTPHSLISRLCLTGLIQAQCHQGCTLQPSLCCGCVCCHTLFFTCDALDFCPSSDNREHYVLRVRYDCYPFASYVTHIWNSSERVCVCIPSQGSLFAVCMFYSHDSLCQCFC